MKTSFKRILLLIASLFIAFLFVLNSGVGAYASSKSTLVVFGPPINLSNDKNPAFYPWVANVGSNVFVAWTEESHGIFFRASSDNGTTWNPPISSQGKQLSSPGGVASYPIVVATGSDVYVTWAQSVSNVLQIFFAASTDSGASFSKAIQLTSGSSSNGFITPVMAAAGSNVYVAYTANGKNSYVVWNNNFGAAGMWHGPFHFAVTHEPQIAAEGSNAYVIADGVQIAVTNNAGNSWTKVLNNINEGDEPWVAAIGNYVYVVSQTKTANGNIHFFSSNNYGKVGSWTSNKPGINISGTITDTWEPQPGVSGTFVYVSFHRLTPGSISNYIVVSNNNGKTWSSPQLINSRPTLSGWPAQVAVSGSYAYTIWPQLVPGPDKWDMFVASSINNGGSWTTTDISHNLGFSGPNNDIATSSVAANQNHGFAVWQDNTSGIYQVLMSVSS